MRLLWAAVLALQSAEDLSKAVEITSREKSYSFTYKRGGAGFNNYKDDRAIEGIYADGSTYFKYLGVQVVRAPEAAYAKLEDGDWRPLAEVWAVLKSRKPKDKDDKKRYWENEDLTLDQLVKLPPPHLILQQAEGFVPKPLAKKGKEATEFTANVPEASLKSFLKLEWVRQGSTMDFMQPKVLGRFRVSDKERVTRIQFEISGRPLPSGSGVPNAPPKDPQAAQGMMRPEVSFEVRVDLADFGKAVLPLPEELAKKWGIRGK